MSTEMKKKSYGRFGFVTCHCNAYIAIRIAMIHSKCYNLFCRIWKLWLNEETRTNLKYTHVYATTYVGVPTPPQKDMARWLRGDISN